MIKQYLLEEYIIQEDYTSAVQYLEFTTGDTPKEALEYAARYAEQNKHVKIMRLIVAELLLNTGLALERAIALDDVAYGDTLRSAAATLDIYINKAVDDGTTVVLKQNVSVQEIATALGQMEHGGL